MAGQTSHLRRTADGDAVITLKSPLAWLLIWSSFVTGVFVAYGIVTVRRFLPEPPRVTWEVSRTSARR